ncbi:elastase-1-like [Colossoma macropomum]|uniref:elastase-1-like n=1 Tax=Colossoma macropomum TaxID=42526 RepID=UPI001864C55D|nr:elastase-1-like [Colossoma macropomum]
MLRILYFTTFAALVLGQSGVAPPGQGGQGQVQNRVVGGSVTSPNAWPWQVSLRAQSGTCYNHVCGGVLIKKNWVLTTAQCVDGIVVSLVVLGEHDLTLAESGKEQFFGVSAIYIHPSWNRDLTAGNDIALIRLTSDAILNSYVQLAPLPSAGQILSGNTACYITGWGVTQNGGFLSAQLRQASLPSVDYATCSSSTWWGTAVKTTMICAGGAGTAAGCNGDSGGPLNCVVGGRYVVHGLTSFVSTAGCNTIRKPTVFTRVSAYLSWVQGITG